MVKTYDDMTPDEKREHDKGRAEKKAYYDKIRSGDPDATRDYANYLKAVKDAVVKARKQIEEEKALKDRTKSVRGDKREEKR